MNRFMVKLGQYFEANEFGKDLPMQILQNYHLLCKFALDDVRGRFGPVRITSGYRSPEDHVRLKKEGYSPSETSQHLYGEACDFFCQAANSMDVYSYLLNVLKWPGELFYYQKRGHVHIALPRYNIIVDQRIMEDR